jgi:hypothetical protein
MRHCALRTLRRLLIVRGRNLIGSDGSSELQAIYSWLIPRTSRKDVKLLGRYVIKRRNIGLKVLGNDLLWYVCQPVYRYPILSEMAK